MLAKLIDYYDLFLALFPATWHGPISLLLLLAVAGTIWHAIRKSGLWLVLAVVLVPTLIPILKGVGVGLLTLLKLLFERASL